MNAFSSKPTEIFASLWRNRELVGILSQRTIQERYRGSILGGAWIFIQPLLLLSIYTVFFGIILKVRWGGEIDNPAQYALIFFAGLVPYNFITECLNAGPGIILGNVSYVKKMVFPLETFSFVSIAAALFQALLSTGIWLLFYVCYFGVPHATALWLPVMYVPLALMALGISWGFAVLGAYFRDISQLTGIIALSLMFFSPIFYSLESANEKLRPILRINPMTGILENIRAVLFWGRPPLWDLYFLSLGQGLLVAWLGFAAFQVTRKEFADGI